jgi:hypothetical protein
VRQLSIADITRTYERPALRKLLAAFPADSKVAAASFAVIATVVSISDKLPPAAAASIADAAAFSSGNSPMTLVRPGGPRRPHAPAPAKLPPVEQLKLAERAATGRTKRPGP